jgi:hypothetical protein
VLTLSENPWDGGSCWLELAKAQIALVRDNWSAIQRIADQLQAKGEICI